MFNQMERSVDMESDHKVLLAVLAHPDDETFGMGGTLALYARQGVKVFLVCATRGEVGEVDPDLLRNFKSIGERREAELRCAAEKLGLSGVFFLDYRDSGMPGSPENQHPQALINAPIDEAAGKVAGIIRQIKPQVLLTFDPIGGYRHPDHIHIHQVTVKAFALAGDPNFILPGLSPFQPQKLYFHTISHGFLKMAVFFLKLFGKDPHHFGKNGDIDIASLVEVDFPTHAIIDYRPVARLREEASNCHESQGGQEMNKGIQRLLSRWFSSRDQYMRAFPPPIKDEKIERDIFAGI